MEVSKFQAQVKAQCAVVQLTSFHLADIVKFRIAREVIPVSSYSTIHGALLRPISIAAIVGFTAGPVDIFNDAPVGIRRWAII